MKSVLLLLVLAFAVGCNRDLSCEDCGTGMVAAKVIDSGPIEADGCGWMIYVDTVYYHPQNLPEAFKINQLEVDVKFDVADELYVCGLAASKYKSINIRQILRR